VVDEGRLVELWNKVDLLSADEAARLAEAAARLPEVVLGSARTGAGLDRLLAELDRRFAGTARVVELDLDPGDGAGLAWLYRHGTVLSRCDQGNRTRLKVALEPADHAQMGARFGAAAIVETGRQKSHEPG
jgi:GTP-binding protein HflX